jgi:hypothetical protein
MTVDVDDYWSLVRAARRTGNTGTDSRAIDVYKDGLLPEDRYRSNLLGRADVGSAERDECGELAAGTLRERRLRNVCTDGEPDATGAPSPLH